ncbi:MAG: hypothetical protein FWE74_02100 [Oscillospiraceae bacterium]|nr:hypothetical protein [Oscillospiraceae bacterium]
MKLKKILAILVVCAVAVSFMVIPASATRLTNSNHNGGDGQHFMIRAYHSANSNNDGLSKEDTMKIYGFEFIIEVSSAPEVGFGGRMIVNDNIGRWRNVAEWSSDTGDNPLKAVQIEGNTYRVRFWSRTTQLITEANFAADQTETYAEFVIGMDWGSAAVKDWNYLDQGGNVIPRGAAPEPKPEPKPEPAAPVEFDGTYKSSDALNILRIAAGLMEADEDMLKVYDLNKDGEITSADAIIVLRIVAGVMDAPDLDDGDDGDDDN